MPISVTAFYPDADLKESEFSNALTKIAMDLTKSFSSERNASAPNIELRFMLAGKLDAPGFTGMRIIAFDSQTNHLVIESAVPKKLNNSNNASKYIIAAMLDAIDNTKELLTETGIIFDASYYSSLVSSIDPDKVVYLNAQRH